MNEPLQEFGWKQSDYDHPQKGWSCGRLCEGTPCPFGPDPRGRCQVQSTCIPNKFGDRFECSRLPVHGGKCEEGPHPDGSCCQADLSCQPVRTLSAIRKMTGWIFFACMMVFCLLITSSSSPEIYIDPGDLTAAHSSLDQKCSRCHVAGEGGLSHWLQKSVDTSTPFEDSQRCLKCHQEMGLTPLLAHGMSPEELKQFRNHQVSPKNRHLSILLTISNKINNASEEEKLKCSSCHREHHGRHSDIKKMTDLQCQKCHQKQFNSFSHGHPELADYPYQQRTGIYFDHANHYSKYFKNNEFKRTMPAGIKPESCNSCHQKNSSGNHFLTKGFDISCASCHESQILDKNFPGIPFIALPALNPGAFIEKKENGIKSKIGEWPNRDRFASISRLPSFMNILVDDSQTDHSEQLTLQQIYSAKLKDNQAIQKQIWKIKQLFHLASHPEDHTEPKVQKQFLKFTDELKPSILPTLIQAQKIWFPNLNEEMKLKSADQSILLNRTNSTKNSDRNKKKLPAMTGWSISFEDYTIRYRPVQHEDPLLKHWLDSIVNKISKNEEPGQSKQEELNKLFRLLANPSSSGSDELKGPIASGSCLKCHSIERNSLGKLKINWKPTTNSYKQNSLTSFSHRPHIISIEQENCRSCHVLNENPVSNSEIFNKEFLRKDKFQLEWIHETNGHSPLSSGFQGISKIKCATCHNQSKVSQSCLQCHQYHFHKKTSIEKEPF